MHNTSGKKAEGVWIFSFRSMSISKSCTMETASPVRAEIFTGYPAAKADNNRFNFLSFAVWPGGRAVKVGYIGLILLHMVYQVIQ